MILNILGLFAGQQQLYKVVQSDGKFKIGMHRIRKFSHTLTDIYYTNNYKVRSRNYVQESLMKKKESHNFPTQNETKASASERAILKGICPIF